MSDYFMQKDLLIFADSEIFKKSEDFKTQNPCNSVGGTRVYTEAE